MGAKERRAHLEEVVDEGVAGVGASALVVEGLVGNLFDARHVHLLLLRPHDLRQRARNVHRPLELLDRLDELEHLLLVAAARQAQVRSDLGVVVLGLGELVLWKMACLKGTSVAL